MKELNDNAKINNRRIPIAEDIENSMIETYLNNNIDVELNDLKFDIEKEINNLNLECFSPN